MLDPDTRRLSLCPTSAKQKHQQDKKGQADVAYL